MIKENKKTLRQINQYQRKHMISNVFGRGCGKSGLALFNMQIYLGLELYKDVIKNANEYMSFDNVLREVVNAIYQSNQED